MPQQKLKAINVKQAKEEIRKKVRTEMKNNPKKLTVLKKESKPKKEYYKEFKRLMSIYLEGSKHVNADNLDNIKLSKDDLIHHLSLKLNKSYSYAFIYIRQLAVTLRQAISNPKKSSVYSVYNWQYMKNLELWTDFIVENGSSNDLIQSLVHPLVQLIVGVIRLRPSARWLPIRFHCLKLLNQVNCSYKNLTPVLANIIEIFNSVNFNQKTKRDSKKTINLMIMLHFSTSHLGTFEHLEQALDEMFQLIIENLAVYSCSPAFPEYIICLTSEIRSFYKKCSESMFSNAYKSLLKKIEDHANYVRKERARRPNIEKINPNPAFEKFIESYRVARLNELENILKATRHSKFQLPQDDYEDKEKNFDAEDKDQVNEDGNESSDLDEEEFEHDDEFDVDSAQEIDDDDE